MYIIYTTLQSYLVGLKLLLFSEMWEAIGSSESQKLRLFLHRSWVGFCVGSIQCIGRRCRREHVRNVQKITLFFFSAATVMNHQLGLANLKPCCQSLAEHLPRNIWVSHGFTKSRLPPIVYQYFPSYIYKWSFLGVSLAVFCPFSDTLKPRISSHWHPVS